MRRAVKEALGAGLKELVFVTADSLTPVEAQIGDIGTGKAERVVVARHDVHGGRDRPGSVAGLPAVRHGDGRGSAGPGMPAAFDGAQAKWRVATSVAHAGSVTGFVKDARRGVIAVQPLTPTRHGVADRGKAERVAAIVGHQRVGGAMYLQDRNGARGRTVRGADDASQHKG